MVNRAPSEAIRPHRRCPICGELSAEELCPVDKVSTLSTDGNTIGINSLSVGSVLGGRYVLERLIGRGGFGSVFLARHTGTGQGVAIKTLSAGLENDDTALRRFFQEARVTAGLKHPNTIRVFDFGQEDNGMLFLAMELLTGVTLRTELKRRLASGRVFSEREAIDIGDAVCRSLAEAHAAGLVHRDLKPDNVFLHRVEGDEVIVKVLDFGIVKSPDSSLTLGSDSSAPGTPAYMSPEQVGKNEIDGRSDLYSLGVVLFSMVTGAVPFRGRDAVQTIYMHVHEPVPDVRALAKTPLSAAFARVLERTLAKDPAARPQDARELRRMLQQCLGEDAASDGGEPASSGVVPAAVGLLDAPSSGPGHATASRPVSLARASVSRRLIVSFSAATAVALALLGWLVWDLWLPARTPADVDIVVAEPSPAAEPAARASAGPKHAEATPETPDVADDSRDAPEASAALPAPSATPTPVEATPNRVARPSIAPTRGARPRRPPIPRASPEKAKDVLDIKI